MWSEKTLSYKVLGFDSAEGMVGSREGGYKVEIEYKGIG
jgi:hypothetical protein